MPGIDTSSFNFKLTKVMLDTMNVVRTSTTLNSDTHKGLEPALAELKKDWAALTSGKPSGISLEE